MEDNQKEQKIKACPFCGETILEIAIKCKHCHSMLDGSTQQPTNPVTKTIMQTIQVKEPFKYLTAHITAIAGSFFIILSIFMPWVSVGFGSLNGIDIPVIGILVLVVGTAIAVLGINGIITKKNKGSTILGLALILILLLGYLFLGNNSTVSDGFFKATAKLSSGYYITVISSIVVFIAGKTTLKEKN